MATKRTGPVESSIRAALSAARAASTVCKKQGISKACQGLVDNAVTSLKAAVNFCLEEER